MLLKVICRVLLKLVSFSSDVVDPKITSFPFRVWIQIMDGLGVELAVHVKEAESPIITGGVS